MASVRIGLIGIGGFGASHLEVIQKLSERDQVRLTAVADPVLTPADSRSAEFLSRGVRCFQDYGGLLAEQDLIDLLVISTPVPLHEEMVRAAVAKGIKVYLEKPPVPTIQQLLGLMALPGSGNVAIGFQMIRKPALLQIKKWIREGALGEVRRITAGACWPRGDGYYGRARWAGKLMLSGVPVFDGPATNANAHVLHNIMFLAGKEMGGFACPEFVCGEFYRAREIESYDAACITGQFESGPEFSFAVAHCTEAELPWELRVVGTKCTAWLGKNGETYGNTLNLSTEAHGTSDDRVLLYEDTLRWVRGEQESPATRLKDCIGYSKTTCGGLVSSGAIHTVPPGQKRSFGTGVERGVDLAGIVTAVQTSLETARPFSSCDVSWARKGTLLPLADFIHVDLSQYA